MMSERERLYEAHCIRLEAHWGKNYDVNLAPWPKTEDEWRKTPHGAPWDTNVRLAQWHLDLARKLLTKGLLDDHP